MKILQRYPKLYLYSGIGYYLYNAINLIYAWITPNENLTQQTQSSYDSIYAQYNIIVWMSIIFVLTPYFADKFIIARSKEGKFFNRKKYYSPVILCLSILVLLLSPFGFIYIPFPKDIILAWDNLDMAFGGPYTNITCFFIINLFLLITDTARTIALFQLRIFKLLMSFIIFYFIRSIISELFIILSTNQNLSALELDLLHKNFNIILIISFNIILALNEYLISVKISTLAKDENIKNLELFFSDRRKRPDLNDQISIEDFQDNYWKKSELKAFCLEKGIAKKGEKAEIQKRVLDFLKARI